MGRRKVLQKVLSHEIRAIARGRRRFEDLPEGDPVEAERELPCLQALYEAEQLDRVRKCPFGSTLSSELTKLNATSFISKAACRLHLSEAMIVGGQLFSGDSRCYFSEHPVYRNLLGDVRELETAQLANSPQGLRFFGHWLRDDCAMRPLMAENEPIISFERSAWPDAVSYERVFEQGWDECSLAYVSDLVLWRELSFNEDKARRLRALRDKLRAKIVGAKPGRIVYLERGENGERRSIENEADLVRVLSGAGVTILRPEDDTDRLLSELLDAKMVISVEGSQLAHAVYTLADSGGVLAIQPPERFYNPHHEWARLMGMRYGIVVGMATEHGFRVAPDEVLAMIDRLLAAMQHQE